MIPINNILKEKKHIKIWVQQENSAGKGACHIRSNLNVDHRTQIKMEQNNKLQSYPLTDDRHTSPESGLLPWVLPWQTGRQPCQKGFWSRGRGGFNTHRILNTFCHTVIQGSTGHCENPFFGKTFKDGVMGAETKVKQRQVSHFIGILRNREIGRAHV